MSKYRVILRQVSMRTVDVPAFTGGEAAEYAVALVKAGHHDSAEVKEPTIIWTEKLEGHTDDD